MTLSNGVNCVLLGADNSELFILSNIIFKYKGRYCIITFILKRGNEIMTNGEFLVKCKCLADMANESLLKNRQDLINTNCVKPLFFWKKFLDVLYECNYAIEHSECWDEPRGRISAEDCRYVDDIVEELGTSLMIMDGITDIDHLDEKPYRLTVSTEYDKNYLPLYSLLSSLWNRLLELGNLAVRAVQGSGKEKNAVKNAYCGLFRLEGYSENAPCANLPEVAPVDVLLKKWRFKDYCRGYSNITPCDQDPDSQNGKAVTISKEIVDELTSSVRNAAERGALAGGEKGARKGAHDASLELVREQTEDGRVRAIGGGAKRQWDIDDDQCRQVLTLADEHPGWSASEVADRSIMKPCDDAKNPYAYEPGMTNEARRRTRLKLLKRVKVLCKREGIRYPWSID